MLLRRVLAEVARVRVLSVARFVWYDSAPISDGILLAKRPLSASPCATQAEKLMNLAP